MTEKELSIRAVAEIAGPVAGVATEPRVVHCESEVEWNGNLLRRVSEHKLHVLARGADIVVFFDQRGQEIGWRDDGRTGSTNPRPFAADALREMIVRELNLPSTARLGPVQTHELPPVGFTHEVLVYLESIPKPDQVVRVWVNPDDYRVIQCLYGPFSPPGGSP